MRSCVYIGQVTGDQQCRHTHHGGAPGWHTVAVLVRDLVTPFVDFAASGATGDLSARWRAEVVEPHVDLFEAIELWVDPADAPARLPALVQRPHRLLAQADRARRAVGQARSLLAADVRDVEAVDVVLLVGLGAANGWATMLHDRPTLFLAVERLPGSGYDAVLALHEMTHAVHLRRTTSDWPNSRVDADLIREGLAVHTTARLMPAVEPSGHLWFASGMQEWVDRCYGLRKALRRRILADWHREDLSPLWFSGAADRDGDVPGRCGYWLGWDLMTRLLANASLDTALAWPLPEASARLSSLLRSLAR